MREKSTARRLKTARSLEAMPRWWLPFESERAPMSARDRALRKTFPPMHWRWGAADRSPKKAGRRSGVPSWTRPANSWNSAKRETRRPPWISGAEKLLIRTGWLVHRDCMRQLEGDRRLRRNLDLLVAG